MTQSTNNELHLTDLLDGNTLQEIQDRFAAVTQVAVSIRDRDGRRLTRPSGTSPFCRLMGASAAARKACRDSFLAAVRNAGTESKPVPYTCYAGMMQYAAPVIVDGQHLGTIIMGDLPSRRLDSQAITRLSAEYGIDESALAKALERVQPWSDQQMAAAVEFLQLLANTLGRFCHQEALLRQRVDELATVYNLTALLSGTRDLNEILRVAAKNVTEVLRVKACSLRLLDREAGELRIAVGHNLSPQYIGKGAVKVSENPIDAQALSGETVYVADLTRDSRIRYPAEAREEGLVSGLVTGLVFRGQPVGVIRVYTGERHKFARFEVSLLRAVAAQIAAAIENKRLTDEAIRAEIVDRQIKTAAEVQRRLLPAKPPKHKHLVFSTVYEPCFDLGGDFYDFLELPGGHLGLPIADVSGKGVPASLLMASVRSSLRTWADTLYHLDDIVGRVNRQLCRDTLSHEFVTLFYGVFSPDARQLTYCNAGHDPPLLVREGQIQRLEVGGMLLGTLSDATYQRAVVDIQPGDVMLFYTDGAIGALNFADQAFGRERLCESLLRYAGLNGEVIAPNILWDVRRFAGLAELNDDITMVTVQVVS
jgi:phosphoserine phosphatase RsbU/P